MRKIMKRGFCLFLVAVLLAGLVPCAFADEAMPTGEVEASEAATEAAEETTAPPETAVPSESTEPPSETTEPPEATETTESETEVTEPEELPEPIRMQIFHSFATSATSGRSTPCRTGAGILPLSRQSWRKPACWQAALPEAWRWTPSLAPALRRRWQSSLVGTTSALS